ncbi:MAG: ABC transporter substrate-binding protein [Solirubrobacteraceae bacterium]
MRKYLFAGVALVMTLIVAGCGGSKGGSNTASNSGTGSSKPYSELRWGMTTVPGVLDWPRNPQIQLLVTESLAAQDLVEFEPDGKIKPALASSVEQPNPTTYVYHLKSVKFSDGKPMTAADVVFSLDRNIDAKESWVKIFWEDVASINAPNGSTVIIKLKQPSTFFPDILAFTSKVIEKESAEKIGEKELGTPGHLPIGTGPWKFDSYTPEAKIQLSRNPYWNGPQPPAEKITINLFKTEASMELALRSGAIDGAFLYQAPKIFSNIPGARVLTAPGTDIVFASANTVEPPFNDVHVRRALAYATNTKGMIEAIYPKGTATEDASVIPASLWTDLGAPSQVQEVLNSLPKYEFNISKAKQELAKSAYPHGFTTELEVEQTAQPQVSAAEILAADLAKIGVTAKVRPLSPAQGTALSLSGKFKLAVQEVVAGYADPEGLMSGLFAPTIVNAAKYNNAEVTGLRTESAKTFNVTRRRQLIGKLLKIEAGEAPYWPLYTHATFGALAEKYVMPTFSYWTMLWAPWALDVKLAS